MVVGVFGDWRCVYFFFLLISMGLLLFELLLEFTNDLINIFALLLLSFSTDFGFRHHPLLVALLALHEND